MVSVTRPVIAQYFLIDDEGSRTWKVKFHDIPFDKLTRLYIAFAWIRESDGKLTYKNTTNKPTDAERISALVKACRAANPFAEIYISSGYDEHGYMYHKAAENPEGFAQSVVHFLRHHSLDGYDMDWENGLEGKMEELKELLEATREALDDASKEDGKPYGLTLATWETVDKYALDKIDKTKKVEPSNYALAEIGKTVDAINIMSYGEGRDLSAIVAEFSEAGFPVPKMIGGIETEKDYEKNLHP